MKKLRGQLKGFPKEIAKKMMKRQVQQGKPKDISVFERNIFNGFVLRESKEGYVFWHRVMNGDFTLFFERYPKKKKNKSFMTVEKFFNDNACDLGYSTFEHWLDCSNIEGQAETIFDWIEEFNQIKTQINLHGKK